MKTIKNNSLKILSILLLASILLGSCSKNKTVVDPPTGSVTINNNDLTTHSNQVKLNLSASDKTGVIGYYASEDQADPDIDNPGWKNLNSKTEYSANVNFELSGGLGEKTVYVWFKNGKKKISLAESDSIKVISNSIPINGTISINNGDLSTHSDEVSLSITVTDSVEITHYYVSENPLNPDIDTTPTNPGWSEANWTVENNTDENSKYSSKVTFYLSNGFGEKSVYVWFKNGAGGISSKAVDTIIFADKPIGSVVINSGDTTTTSPALSLALEYSGHTAVDYYYVSDSSTPPEANDQNWKNIKNIGESNTIRFTVSNNPGEKQVYVWFKNSAGVLSRVASDKIMLEGIPGAPTAISINIKPEDPDLPSPDVTLDRIVKLDISAQDSVGIIAYYISENPAIPTTTTTATNPGWISVLSTEDCSIDDLFFTLSRGLGEKTVYVWFKNSDDIISPVASDAIVLADTPTGEVIINNNDEISDSHRVTLKLTVSSGTPVTRYYVSESSTAPDADTVWNYTMAKFPVESFFNFSGEELGERTLYVWFMNNGGIVSSALSDTITLIDKPTGEVTIDSNAIATDSTDVTLNFTANGKIDITAYYVSENATPPTIYTAGWVSTAHTTSYQDDASFSFFNTDSGEKTIYAWFMNEAGAISLVASDNIILADRPVGSFTINGDAANTNKFRVTLNLDAQGNTTLNGYYLSNDAKTPEADDSNWVTIEPVQRYIADTPFTLSSGLGEKTVYVWFKNSVSLVSARVSKTINLIEDQTAPEGSVIINNNELATTSLNINLHLSATDSFGDVTDYYASEGSTAPTSGSNWKNYSEHVSFKLSDPDENKTVYVWFRDDSGNISENASDSIYLDRVAPHGGISSDSENSDVGVTIEGGENSKTHEVKIRITGYDAVALIGYYISGSSTTPASDAQGWHELGSQPQNFNEEIDYTLPGGDGDKTVYVWFKDMADNISGRSSDSIIVDTTAPTGSITVNSGESYTRSSRVTLNLTSSDSLSGVVSYYASESSATPTTGSDWKTYSNSVSFTLSERDGEKRVYVWFKDRAGNISQRVSDSITVDTTVSSGSVIINNGDRYTRSSRVTLKFTGLDSNSGITGYHASERSTTPTAGSNWYNYSSSVNFTLSERDGEKRVYVWFKDGAGNISQVASDTIKLDATVPTGSVIINNGNTYTRASGVTLSLTSSDSLSGVVSYYVSESSVAPTTGSDWRTYSNSVSFTLSGGDEEKTVYTWFKDQAGNISATSSDTIKLDTTAPTGSVIINNGDAYTRSVRVTLSLNAQDSLSGVTSYYVSESLTTPTENSNWKHYSNNAYFTLSTENGNKSVYVWFKDIAGNISRAVSDRITVDAAAPSGSVIINNGDVATTSRGVTLKFSTSDSSGRVTSYYASERPTAPTASSNWASYSTEVSFNLFDMAGKRTVYIWFKDGAGNVSSRVNDEIHLDKTAPHGGTTANSASDNAGLTIIGDVFVNNGNLASSHNVRLDITGTDDVAVTGYYVSNSSNRPTLSDSGWHQIYYPSLNFSITINHTLSGGDGSKTVYFWLKDMVGHISSADSDSITIDTTAPSGSVVINGGAATTDQRDVTLRLSATDTYGVASYYLTESAATPASGATWHTYSGSANFKLSDGDGEKTVYVWFKDRVGNKRQVSDRITLTTADVTAPVASYIKINSDNTLTTDSRDVVVHVRASDGIGVTGHYISESSSKPSLGSSGWVSVNSQTSVRIDHSFKLSAGSGNKTVYVWLKDAAGNISSRYNDIITLNDEEDDVQTLSGDKDGDLLGGDFDQQNDDELVLGNGKGDNGLEDGSFALNDDENTDLGGLYIAVGSGGTILTSTDGDTWSSRNSGVTGTINSIAYGNGKFMAVSENGYVISSENGTSWTATHLTTNKLKGVAFGNNRFSIVGAWNGSRDASDSGAFTSTDGRSWTKVGITGDSGSYPTIDFSSVRYLNGTFMAVGEGYMVEKSTNATNWTETHHENSGIYYLRGSAYGNGRFVAMGDKGHSFTSRDGISWSLNSIPTFDSNYVFFDVVYGDGKFVSVGKGAGNKGISHSSSHGTYWEKSSDSENYGILLGVTYGNGAFTAVGMSGTIITSTDGNTWTKKTSGTTAYLRGIIYQSGLTTDGDMGDNGQNGGDAADKNNGGFSSNQDTEAPVGGAFVMRDSFTESKDICSKKAMFRLIATDNVGVTGYYISEFSSKPREDADEWVFLPTRTSYNKHITYPINVQDGRKTFYLWFKDAAGNVSDAVSYRILIDSEPPDTSIKINYGDSSTSKRDVVLSLSALDMYGPIYGYYLSEEPTQPSRASDYMTTDNRRYNGVVHYTLSEGNGKKTVYLWFRDKAGNVSAATSDSIELTGQSSSSLLVQIGNQLGGSLNGF